MFNTYDRYLLRRYISTFLIMFVSTYGLFVVIDGFTNADEYFDDSRSTLQNLQTMGGEYLYRTSSFFDMTGSILSVVTVIIVLGLIQYQKEIHPLLAAGIPSYRLIRPLILGAFIANLLMIANTELIMPKVSLLLQSSRGEGLKTGKLVEPVQDYELHINIDGDRVYASTRSMENARFILAAPFLVEELATLSSPNAVYYPEVPNKHPSGWKLEDVSPKLDQLKLTEAGKKNLLRLKGSDDVFVATKVSFHQIYSKGGNYLYDTTPQLIQRVNSPALSQASINRQILFLHNRIARPIQNLVAVMLLIPFVMRKESRSLITSMAIACGVLVGMLAIQQLANFLASAKIVTPDFAVWIPVLIGGGLASWFSEDILT